MEFRIDHFVNALIYAVLGGVIYFIAFFLIDKLTPGDLWQEIVEKHNIAFAIVIAALVLGFGVIIAAAVH